MEINFDRLQYISGPSNVSLLEGKIGDVNKRILLFGENHSHGNVCDDDYSVTITQFLTHLFRNTKKEIHFFLEILNKDIEYFKSFDRKYHMNDINELRYVFSNKKYNNIKFHYSDIRYFYGNRNIFNLLYDPGDKLLYIINNDKFFNMNDINSYYDDIRSYSTIINLVVNGLKIDEKEYNKIKVEDTFIEFKKNLHKIFYKIDDDNIKKQIRSIIKITLVQVQSKFEKFKKHINENEKIVKKNLFNRMTDIETDKVVYEFIRDIRIFYKYISIFIVLLTDLFTVRRILDKSYIENVITFNGSSHTTNLVNILVNNFDFKIISDYSNVKYDISKNYFNKFYDYSTNKYYEDDQINPIQCIDISKFPKPLL